MIENWNGVRGVLSLGGIIYEIGGPLKQIDKFFIWSSIIFL